MFYHLLTNNSMIAVSDRLLICKSFCSCLHKLVSSQPSHILIIRFPGRFWGTRFKGYFFLTSVDEVKVLLPKCKIKWISMFELDKNLQTLVKNYQGN